MLNLITLVGLAAVIALVTGHVIHNDFGVPNGTIRIDAFAAAGVLTAFCALKLIKSKE